jgi:hypothetical protein
MDLSPIRLDFDLDPADAGRVGGSLVRLPMLRQAVDADYALSWLIDGAPFDFTLYAATLTARVTVQDAAALFTLTSAAGEIALESGAITLKFAAAKTARIAVPSSLPRVAGPQIIRMGYDIVLTAGSRVYPAAAGTLCMQYAFTRG